MKELKYFIISIISLYFIRLLPTSKILFLSAFAILFSVMGLILIAMIVITLSDNIYRPNIPQYPFNTWVDRIIPLMFLFTPSLCILILHPFDTWFSCLLLLILIHIIIIIPIFYYWSKYRRWNDIEDKFTYTSWNHPRLYKHIAIASIYPLLWGIYFSTVRFFRLGSTIQVYDSLPRLDFDTFILLLFLFFYLIIFALILLYKLSVLRRYLWSELSSLLYSIHIILLRFYPYFRVMELIFKFGFIIRSLLSIHGPMYYVISKSQNQFPWWRRLVDYLSFRTFWFTIIFFISLFIEIIITGKLYYGIYTLFFYPLVRGILSCFFAYSRTEFVFDSCFSDYIHRHWIDPRYPYPFWMYFKDAEYFFGFAHEFNQLEVDVITKELEKSKWRLRKISLDSHQDQLDFRVNQIGKIIKYKYKYPFGIRLAASYVSSNRVRWTHSLAFKYHSATTLFARSIYDRIVLANNSWRNVEQIQRLRVADMTPPNMYRDYGQTFQYNRRYFMGVHEENIPSNFKPLIEQGVKIEPYEKTIHTPEYFPQINPDVIFMFSNSTFIDKRFHALDVKTNNPGQGRSLLLSNITEYRYRSTINCLQKELETMQILNEGIRIAFSHLKNSCLDLDRHQMVWAEYLHLFPSTHIPPMKVPQNFSLREFSDKALKEINRSELRMKKVSDYLYFKKVPQTSHGNFPKEALDLFEDSAMQKMLNEDQGNSIDFVDNILN